MIFNVNHILLAFVTFLQLIFLKITNFFAFGIQKLLPALKNKQDKEMESKKNKAYYKLLLHFLSLSRHNEKNEETSLSRKRSFEYMELTGKQVDGELIDSDEITKPRPVLAPLTDKSCHNRRKVTQLDHHDNVRKHASRQDASCTQRLFPHDDHELQSNEEIKEIEAPLEKEVFLDESKSTFDRKDVLEEYDVLSTREDIQQGFDGSIASEDEWSMKLIEELPNLPTPSDTTTLTEQPSPLVTCLNDQLPSNENEPATSNYDVQRFTPTLASIDEDDEDHPLDDSSAALEGLQNDSEVKHSSQALECPLQRSSTFNDLRVDECEDNSFSGDLTIHLDENTFPESFDEDEPELAAMTTNMDMTSHEDLQKSVEDDTRLHNDKFMTSQSPLKAKCEHTPAMTSFTPDYVTPLRDEPTTPRTPILRPDSPPVVVVDSLEDYVKTVIPEEWFRTRSRRSSNNTSYRSSLDDSAYSSRERLNALHHSNPDITLDSCDDDIDLQYLPVSYADVTLRKRKKWVKRSTSDVHDNYYFSGETQGNKFNTLKKQLVRKLSRRHRKPAEEPPQDGASDKPQNTFLKPNDEKIRRKPSRVGSIRDTVQGIFRRIRDKKHRRKQNKLKKRTRSLPTQLDSCSSFDYYVTDSETTTDT